MGDARGDDNLVAKQNSGYTRWYSRSQCWILVARSGLPLSTPAQFVRSSCRKPRMCCGEVDFSAQRINKTTLREHLLEAPCLSFNIVTEPIERETKTQGWKTRDPEEFHRPLLPCLGLCCSYVNISAPHESLPVNSVASLVVQMPTLMYLALKSKYVRCHAETTLTRTFSDIPLFSANLTFTGDGDKVDLSVVTQSTGQ